jgi:alpha-1,3-rhamnosyl/mannosyltransferase
VEQQIPRIALDVAPILANPAGVGLYAALLARGLVNAEADVRLIGLRDEAGFPGGTPSAPALAFTGPTYHVWIQAGADRDARSLGSNLVHYTNAAGPVVSRLPYVVTVHDLSVLRMPETHPVRRWPVVLFNVAAIARARLIIVPSAFTARELGRLGVDRRRVAVVPHAPTLGASDAGGASGAESADETLATWGLDRGGYLLYVGTLEPRKNVARLVEAFERIAPDRPGLKLVLAGAPGWHYGPIGRRIAASTQRERIVLTGYAEPETLAPLIANSAAVAYVSLYEGFGMPVLDSMALGTPVVTSNRTATVEAAGGAATLVDPYDVADIARGLAAVLDSPDEFRARALARAGTRDWTDVAREHLDAYRFALSR